CAPSGWPILPGPGLRLWREGLETSFSKARGPGSRVGSAAAGFARGAGVVTNGKGKAGAVRIVGASQFLWNRTAFFLRNMRDMPGMAQLSGDFILKFDQIAGLGPIGWIP